MPTYVYLCPECSREKTVTHSIHDEPNIKCPQCDYSPMEIKIQPVTYLFKGKGWPGREDYRNHSD